MKVDRYDHTLRYLRTVRNLRPGQLAHRVRLRGQQAALRRWPEPIARRWTLRGGTPTSWPETFTALDAVAPPDCGTIDDLEQGRFRFLNETRELGVAPIGWDPPGASQLWLYHQHYWEWAWVLANDPDCDRARASFQLQIESWLAATTFGRWNAWAPYPTSLRAWVFVNVAGTLVGGSPVEEAFDDLLRLHAGFVRHNLELDVGGNHLLKNLKAMIGLGVYLDDHDLVDQAIDRLAEQLTVQVLPDGGHFEQSPSYHCQVLADLIDISSLLAAASRPGPAGIEAAIARMRTWLGVILMPDGDVPLFNDAERVGAARIGALGARAATEGPLTVLADSGYVVGRADSRIHVVVDVGGPGPKELPAHMHADSLSFELAIDGRRLVIDPGTSVYGGSPQRQWERSTPAHNTISIDGVDQTEVWGAFRAGRLAETVLDWARVIDGGVEIAAHHLGYAHLGGAPVHRRTWRVTAERLEVIDRVEGTGLHTVGLRLLVDARRVKRHDGERLLCDGCAITVAGPGGAQSGLTVRDAQFATAHGSFADAVAIEGTWTCALPTDLVTVIQLLPARP